MPVATLQCTFRGTDCIHVFRNTSSYTWRTTVGTNIQSFSFSASDLTKMLDFLQDEDEWVPEAELGMEYVTVRYKVIKLPGEARARQYAILTFNVGDQIIAEPKELVDMLKKVLCVSQPYLLLT